MQIATGVRVVSVTDGGPAAKAGIARGDLLTSIDGTAVQTAQQVIDAVGNHKPGDTVKIGVVHAADGAASEAAVTLAENPQDAAKAFLGVQLGSFGVSPRSGRAGSRRPHPPRHGPGRSQQIQRYGRLSRGRGRRSQEGRCSDRSAPGSSPATPRSRCSASL